MLRLKRLLTYFALAVLLLTLDVSGAKAQSESGQESRKPDVVIGKPDVVMHVSGLACSMCARSATNELEKVDAIEDIQVLIEDDQRILLTLKEGKKADEKTLSEAVERAGFSTREVVFKAHKELPLN